MERLLIFLHEWVVKTHTSRFDRNNPFHLVLADVGTFVFCHERKDLHGIILYNNYKEHRKALSADAITQQLVSPE